MAEKWVEIERPTDGMNYQVKLADFDKRKLYQDLGTGEVLTYKDAGFRILRYADQSAYVPSEEPRAATVAGKKDDAKP